MMFERRLSFHIDWALLAAVASLCAIGLVMIYSTTYAGDGAGPQFWTQLYALALGAIALVICLSIDYRALAEHSLITYGLFCGLLLYVMFFGAVRGGARRWIDPGRTDPHLGFPALGPPHRDPIEPYVRGPTSGHRRGRGSR